MLATGKRRGALAEPQISEANLAQRAERADDFRMIGEEFSPRDPMALSALGEIANVVTGNAATQLTANGFTCDISPPVILEPRGATLTSAVPRQILVTFDSELGRMCVRIGLSENAREKRRSEDA